MSVKSIQGQFVALGCFMYKGIKNVTSKKKTFCEVYGSRIFCPMQICQYQFALSILPNASLQITNSKLIELQTLRQVCFPLPNPAGKGETCQQS